MSRSIHTTRRTLKEIAKRKHPTLREKADAYFKALSELRRKRRLKEQVLTERSRPEPPLAGTPIATIPIEVRDAGPWVHHPASPEDIRSVLSELPCTATEGISEIRLCLGKEFMEEADADRDVKRDPFTGRCSYENMPGLYNGEALGLYQPPSGRISLYAYVYDVARLPLPRGLCELYLRLRVLKTLMHEVAHHHDDTQRVRRGRWLSDRKENFEWYAEKMEHQWTLDVVVPYLRRTYPKETQALRRWVAHRGGILLPLEFFAGDTRSTERNGHTRIVFSSSYAFEEWLEALPAHATLQASRLAFAWKLHHVDQYVECLAILENLLATDPLDVPALVCRADTLVHLERFDDALACSEQVLSLAPANTGAWKTRGEVLQKRQDWNGLLENCRRWQASGKMKRLAERELWQQWAVAFCALDRQTEMEATLEGLWTTFRFKTEEQARSQRLFHRKSVYRRAGKPIPPSLQLEAKA